MIPTARAALALGLALGLLPACAGTSRLDLRHFGERAMWQRPEQVVRALALAPGDRVADLGPGDGYFLPYLSEAVGPQGRVYAVEVDANRILDLTARVEERGLRNVELVLGDPDDPRLPDGRIDLALVVNAFRRIEDRPAYLARLRDALRPSGRVALIEPDPELEGVLRWLVDGEQASSRAALRREMRAVGYAPAASFSFLPAQVFEVFSLPGALAAGG